jgi:hypothetical protein
MLIGGSLNDLFVRGVPILDFHARHRTVGRSGFEHRGENAGHGTVKLCSRNCNGRYRMLGVLPHAP